MVKPTMSRYRFESVTYNNDELHVRVSEPDSAMHPANDLKIEFDEMSGDRPCSLMAGRGRKSHRGKRI